MNIVKDTDNNKIDNEQFWCTDKFKTVQVKSVTKSKIEDNDSKIIMDKSIKITKEKKNY